MKWTFRGEAVTLPHVWTPPDISVEDEGPYVYECRASLQQPMWLVFEGVSYAADVSVNGRFALRHEGIWDAFAVPLPADEVVIEVSVTKNGGPTFPVKEVLSGFLPYVYQTWGGIHGDVWLSETEPILERPAALPSVEVVGTQLFVEGQPFWMRGALTWGWYPETGHPHPPAEVIEREIAQMKAMGFNTVKFCLWLPPHRYLEALRRHGMWAWLELPVWLPSADPAAQARWVEEIQRIVRQYRHHPAIFAWTIGCELSQETTAEWRRDLTEWVREATGCPLVKDNSGGAEMYGGDPREFGTFADFHPYCDGPFFPAVLETLRHGPRRRVPILLGETNDYDQHRSLLALKQEDHDWAADDPRRNAQGVRWQYDLPRILHRSEEPLAKSGSEDWNELLAARSRSKAQFLRRRIAESVRMNGDIAGWALTGWRHTPISTSGFVDDAGDPLFTPGQMAEWNGPDFVALVPRRCPPWVNGGNRPGWHDTQNFFAGLCHFQLAVVAESGAREPLRWALGSASGSLEVNAAACEPTFAGEFAVDLEPGRHELRVEWRGQTWTWPVWVHERLAALPEEIRAVEGEPRPFWRECIFDYTEEMPFADRWEWLWAVGGDKVLPGEYDDVLMWRIDTRTYERRPLIARAGKEIVTSLRPQGGLGVQPPDFDRNPAGHGLVAALARLI